MRLGRSRDEFANALYHPPNVILGAAECSWVMSRIVSQPSPNAHLLAVCGRVGGYRAEVPSLSDCPVVFADRAVASDGQTELVAQAPEVNFKDTALQ